MARSTIPRTRTAGPRGRTHRALAAATLLGAAAVAARDEPARIVVYAGYGTPGAFVLSGRVLEGDPPPAPDRARGRLRDAADTWRAFATDEVEGARVEVEVAGRTFAAHTDEDGIWRVEEARLGAPLPVGALPVRVRVTGRGGRKVPVARGVLHVWDEGPAVAVVSDLDDTVVESGVRSKGKLLYRTFTRNAAQMEPVPGVADAFARAARAGARAFFYVSASPQNLYERLAAFLELRGLPPGPLLLKNVGEDPLLDPRRYKSGRIEALLAAFPRWRFVLVGDSGEQDPEIYAAIRAAHPERVAGIVIRRVEGGDEREGRFEGMTVVGDYAARPDVLAALAHGG